MIFVIFLTPALISRSKFDTKKRVNRDTADFATKHYSSAKAKIQLKFKRCGVVWSGVEWCGVEWCSQVPRPSCEVSWGTWLVLLQPIFAQFNPLTFSVLNLSEDLVVNFCTTFKYSKMHIHHPGAGQHIQPIFTCQLSLL